MIYNIKSTCILKKYEKKLKKKKKFKKKSKKIQRKENTKIQHTCNR